MKRPATATKRRPASVEASSDLLRDYHQTLIPPLRQDLGGVFEVVQPSGQNARTELVSVGSDESLKYFYPDPASHSGWTLQTIPVPDAPDSPIDRLEAFFQDGFLYALALYAKASKSSGTHQVVGLFSEGSGADWGPVPLTARLASALQEMRQLAVYRDADGRCFIYGIATKAFDVPTFILAGQDPTTKKWTINYLEAVADSTSSYKIIDGYSGNQMTLLRFDGTKITLQGGSIVNGTFKPAGGPTTHDLGHGTLTADEAISVSSKQHQQGFLLLTSSQELFLVTGYDGGELTVTSLGGGKGAPAKFLAVAMGADLAGNFVLFSISAADNTLWLARQSASAAGQPVAFDPWVALGTPVTALGCPAAMSDGPEVFLVGLDEDLTHLTQAKTDRIWKSSTLATPSPASQAPATRRAYSRQFVVRDGHGNLVPNAEVRLRADRKVTLTVNGLTHHVDTVNSATTLSGLHGRVVVSGEAVALTSSALDLELVDAAATAQGPFRADLRTHQRLAGRDDSFSVDGEALRAAGLIPPSVSNHDADRYAASLKQIAALAVKKHAASPPSVTAPAQVGTALRMDFSGSSPVLATMSPQEADVAWHAASDGTSFWGDVAHFFEQSIDDLVHLTIQVLEDAARVIINGVKYLLDTLADVVSAIEVFLVKIAKAIVHAIEKAIDWLRMLFDWDDVIRTQTVITYYLSQSLKNVQQEVSDPELQQLIGNGFKTLRSEIGQAIANAKRYFSNGHSLTQMVPKTWNNPISGGGEPLMAGGARSAVSSHAARLHYLHNKVSAHLGTGGSFTGPTETGTSVLDQLREVFEKQFSTQQLAQATTTIRDLQQSVHGADSFADVAMIVLLDALDVLVTMLLDGIEAVLLTLVKLAGQALSELQTYLSSPLDIPVVSWLYHELTGETLTLQSLLTLLIALPGTILYKLLLGGSSLTPPFSAATVKAITSKPIPWPSFGGSHVATNSAKTPPDEVSSTDSALAFMFFISMLFYALEDMVMDVVTAQAVDDPSVFEEYRKEIEFFTWATIATSIIAQGLGVPYKALADPGTEADKWVIVTWAAAWIPVAADLTAALGNKTLMRSVDELGPLLSNGLGILTLTLAIPTFNLINVDPSYNNWNKAELFLPSFPYVFQPIVLAGWDGIPNAIAQGFLLFVDGFCDIGTGVCKVAGTEASPEAAPTEGR